MQTKKIDMDHDQEDQNAGQDKAMSAKNLVSVRLPI